MPIIKSAKKRVRQAEKRLARNRIEKRALRDRLKGASTVLITTSNNPSIDQLTAALGLGQMLKKLGKSVTTTITATIPKKISFLEADKQFIDNLDSLRDFIISLDKKLADKLRYKVEVALAKF